MIKNMFIITICVSILIFVSHLYAKVYKFRKKNLIIGVPFLNKPQTLQPIGSSFKAAYKISITTNLGFDAATRGADGVS